jgi:hypothetical protein
VIWVERLLGNGMSADGLVLRHLRPVTAHEPRERDLICIRLRGCVNDPPAPVLKGLGADVDLRAGATAP